MEKFLLIVVATIASATAAFSQTIVTSDNSVNRSASTWRFAVHGGGAYRLGRVDKGVDPVILDHTKKLKRGYTYGADATWFFSEAIGVGVKYHNMHAGNSENVTVAFDDGSQGHGILEDRIDIWFLGPMVSFRWLDASKKRAFYINNGVGYMGYDDRAKMIDNYRLKGGTAGLLIDLGYDISISDRLSVGASLYLVGGTLNAYKMTDQYGNSKHVDLDEGNYEGLGHACLSVGLRWNL